MIEIGFSSLILTLIANIICNCLALPCSGVMLFGVNVILNVLAYGMKEYVPSLSGKLRNGIWYILFFFLELVLYQLQLIGIKKIWNALVEAIDSYYGLALYQFSVGAHSDWIVMLPFLFVGGLLIPQIVWNEKKYLNFWILAELATVGILISLLVGKSPDFLSTMILVVVLFAERICYPKEYRQLSIHNQVVMLTTLCICAGISLVLIQGLKGTMQARHNSFLSFQKRIESRMGLDGFSGYTDGYLTNSAPKKTHKVMLTVIDDARVEGKQYYRGFIGADYKNGKWISADEEAFYKVMKKKGKTKAQLSEQVLNYPYTAMAGVSALSLRKIEIFYPGVNDSYSYAPYFVNYDATNNYLVEQGDTNFLRKRKDSTKYLMYTPESYQTADWNEVKDNKYDSFVEQQYSSVPSECSKVLKEFLGEYHGNSTSDAIAHVRMRLQSECKYSTELERLKFGEDYVKHFLTVEKKGYCCHFATAGVLLLRSLGVPARYATGYGAYIDDFYQNNELNYQADLTDDAAHAWVEVYYKGLGWIPVEVTPGYDDDIMVQDGVTKRDITKEEQKWTAENTTELSEEAYTSSVNTTQNSVQGTTTQNISESGIEDTQTKENKNKKESQTIHSKKTNSSFSLQFKAGAMRVVIPYGKIGILLLGGLLVWSMLYLPKSVRKRKRHQRDPEKAVRAIREQMTQQFYKKVGKPKEKEEEASYILRAATTILEHKKDGKQLSSKEIQRLCHQYYAILLKLEFSKELLSKDDARLVNQLFDCLFKR